MRPFSSSAPNYIAEWRSRISLGSYPRGRGCNSRLRNQHENRGTHEPNRREVFRGATEFFLNRLSAKGCSHLRLFAFYDYDREIFSAKEVFLCLNRVQNAAKFTPKDLYVSCPTSRSAIHRLTSFVIHRRGGRSQKISRHGICTCVGYV